MEEILNFAAFLGLPLLTVILMMKSLRMGSKVLKGPSAEERLEWARMEQKHLEHERARLSTQISELEEEIQKKSAV